MISFALPIPLIAFHGSSFFSGALLSIGLGAVGSATVGLVGVVGVGVGSAGLAEVRLAQEYKIVGVYEDFITWEKDELFMPNYYRNIVVDTTEYDKDPIS